MSEGTDNIQLNEQLESLKEMLAKNTLATERVLWIISDPDTGLVKRVGDIGQVTGNTVKEQIELTAQVRSLTRDVSQIQERQAKVMERQEKHDDAINDLLDCAEKAKEARKPFVAIAFSILEKVLLIAALGIIGWLGQIVLAK